MKSYRASRFRLSAFFLIVACIPTQAQWVKTSGPDSVRALTYINSKVGSIYRDEILAGTRNGVFRSLDSGKTWAAFNDGLTYKSVSTFSKFGSILYAGTAGGGIFRLVDSNKTWVAVNTGLTNLNVRALYPYCVGFCAGTEGGVFRSQNGTEWVAIGMASTVVNSFESHGGFLYVGTEGSGIFRTSDNGANWIAFNAGLNNLKVRSLIYDASWLNAATDSGVYRLPYNSQTWTLEDFPPGNIPAVRAMVSTGVATDIPVYLLAATTGHGVYMSDHGIGWAMINTGLIEMDVRAIVFVGGSFLYVGTDGGVWRRPWSEVQPAKIQSDGLEVAMDFHLDQNGYAAFNLLIPSRVTLEAFTPMGDRTAILVDNLPSGPHSLRLNDMVSRRGLYLYRLRVGNNTEIRKVILAK
jgi:hypothetical protein